MGCCTMEPGWPGLCVFLEPATWGMSPFWKRTTSIFWVTLTQVKTSLGAKSQEKKIRPHKGPRPWKIKIIKPEVLASGEKPWGYTSTGKYSTGWKNE